jgi:hypothetical protein
MTRQRKVVTAVTVAVRTSLLMSASSPKWSPGAQRRNLSPVDADHRLAVHDDEEADPAHAALPNNSSARPKVAFLAATRKLPELSLVQVAEERNLL